VRFSVLLPVALLVLPITMFAGTNLGMQLSSNPDTAIICDNNVNFTGCTGNASDMNGNWGQITFSGQVGEWTTNVTNGFGPPYEQLVPILAINSFDATAPAGAAPMTVLLSAIGITSPQGLQQFLNSVGGTSSASGTTISAQVWLSLSNIAFCASTSCGTAITSLLTLTGAAFSGSVNGLANVGTSPYALTMVVTIDSHGLADTTSFNQQFSQVPESPSPFVTGLGLLGVSVALRRKLLRA
jgi:hypothetical protein